MAEQWGTGGGQDLRLKASATYVLEFAESERAHLPGLARTGASMNATIIDAPIKALLIASGQSQSRQYGERLRGVREPVLSRDHYCRLAGAGYGQLS
jgi:hypothetical protein